MKYQLFRIEWAGDYPLIPCDIYEVVLPTVGTRVGCNNKRYRIFGFTDDRNWTERYKNTAQRGSFFEVPCDAYANRKYAIGRLGQ